MTDTRAEIEVAPGTVLTVARQVVVRRVDELEDSDGLRAHRPERADRSHRGRGLRRTNTVAKKTPRPGRTLLIFGLSILVLYGLAALGQTWKPRLGLDLEGGTRITLSAIEQGGAITPTKLKQAAGIVDARVNGSGVSEAEVSTQGNRNIIVEIPGKNASSLVDAVKRTAQLRFRLVAGQPQPGTPGRRASASPSPSGKASPSATPPKKASTRRTANPATPNPRPAPFAAPKPTPTPDAGHPVDAAPPRRRRQPTAKGAPVDDPVAWAQNPGEEWLQKFAAFTCPAKGEDAAPVADNSDQPLITCNDKGQKFLLSKPSSRAPS